MTAADQLTARGCGRCRVAFTADELANADAAIHTDPDTGEDVHEACCPQCSGRARLAAEQDG